MFVLGFHFPASMGNNIPAETVVEKLNSSIGDALNGVKEIRLYEGSNKSNEISLYKVYTNKDTFLAKALVHYFVQDNPSKKPKYLIYTNKYQMSEISKQVDKDEETLDICKKLDGMEPITIDVIYN